MADFVGRQARGCLRDIYCISEFALTSGAFNDVVQLDNNDDVVVKEVSSPINITNYFPEDLTNVYINSDASTITTWTKRGSDGSLENVNTVSVTGNVYSVSDRLFGGTGKYNNLKYITDISANDGLYKSTNNVYTYSARVFTVDSYSDDEHTVFNKGAIEVQSEQFDGFDKSTDAIVSAYITDIKFTKYCMSIDTNMSKPYLHEWTIDTTVYTSVNNQFGEIQLVSPESYISLTITAELATTASASMQIDIPVTATRLAVGHTDDNYVDATANTLLSTVSTSAVNIHLSPVMHAGGFCGEYIVNDLVEKSYNIVKTDKQTEFTSSRYDFIDAFAANVYCNVKLTTADIPSNIDIPQYNQYNTIAGFAADLALDTMNKTNCDVLSGYPYTSARTNPVTNFINVYCGFDEQTTSTKIDTFATTSDFIRYFNYTPDAMPAVIMSTAHGKSHAEGKTFEPNFGNTWLDQLFVAGNAYPHVNTEFADSYINAPAQTINSISAKETLLNAWENHESLYDTYFYFAYADIANRSTVTSYITKQSTVTSASTGVNTIDTPFQYSQGRIGYDTTANEYSYSTNTNYYLPVTAKVHTDSNVKDISDKIENIVFDNSSIHHDTTPAFVYTYDTKTVSNKLPVVPFYIQYADNYLLAKDESIRLADTLDETYTISASKNKAYTLSSNSYSTIYLANKDTYTALPVFEQDGNPLSSNSLVFGYIPSSADILYCLNQSIVGKLTCSGISADDLQYMLVVDDKHRTIFDTKLDITAADNDGYIVDFPEIRSFDTVQQESVHSLGSLSGLAINIVNG